MTSGTDCQGETVVMVQGRIPAFTGNGFLESVEEKSVNTTE